MGFRGKLALVFASLLVIAVTAISILEFERTTRLMVSTLEDSGVALANQIFEQMRVALGQGHGDPAATLRTDPAIASSLRSAQAFTKGVVYARIVTADGSFIAGTPLDPASDALMVRPFEELSSQAARRFALDHLHSLWTDRIYEVSRPVDMNGHPFAIIKVGLSTVLIEQEVRATLKGIFVVAIIGVVLALAGGAVAGAYFLRPVAAIAGGVEELASGSGDIKVNVAAHDEFGTLAEKFNQLSRRIKNDRAQWETERGQFFNIFRSITDALLLLDAHGHVLFANAEAQGKLGLPAGGLADGRPLALLLGRDHPLNRMIENAYVVGSEVRDVAMELGRGAGAMRVLVSIFSLGQGPEPPGLLVIVRDLDPVQELENVVNYSGRLARLGGLISGVAHQIRNPLNAMNLQLELLNDEAAQGKPIEARVMKVRGEIMRLDEAISALLRFMRPEQLKLTQIDLDDLLHEVGRGVEQPEVVVKYALAPDASHVTGDR
ncbi:MAG TPA: histidine kinase dimerization/phospho-acceptor domain-containing protein, partial [Candidatus Binataceae bacterium]|nr:histidine kinase dimerization/phospho-acceptor domain-containing protein [Candidatus Binataceae bacterium]